MINIILDFFDTSGVSGENSLVSIPAPVSLLASILFSIYVPFLFTVRQVNIARKQLTIKTSNRSH